VKVRGYLRCIRAFAPKMAEVGWGRIVNVAGLAARRTGNVTGSVRNLAVVAMTKNLADELGPSGVTVNVVHPGTTRTETLAEQLARRAASAQTTPEAVEAALAAEVALGRLMTAEEVAWVIAFLASERCVAVNGDVVVASGGIRGPLFA
jgi:NAD(P)-dependent dehydrogenase (short-subunit alcohol dehydrogenase family)